MKAKLELSHSRRSLLRGLDIPILVHDLPQRGEHLRRVIVALFDETVDLFLDTGLGRFRRRVLYPDVCELLDV